MQGQKLQLLCINFLPLYVYFLEHEQQNNAFVENTFIYSCLYWDFYDFLQL